MPVQWPRGTLSHPGSTSQAVAADCAKARPPLVPGATADQRHATSCGSWGCSARASSSSRLQRPPFPNTARIYLTPVRDPPVLFSFLSFNPLHCSSELIDSVRPARSTLDHVHTTLVVILSTLFTNSLSLSLTCSLSVDVASPSRNARTPSARTSIPDTPLTALPVSTSLLL